jgi:hypothetical protein
MTVSRLFNIKQNSVSVSFKIEVTCSRVILTTALKVKVLINVKLTPCLTNLNTIRTYREVEVQLHPFLTSALDGGDWSASRPGRFPPGKSPRYSLVPRAGLDAVVKRKKSLLLPRIYPGRPTCSLATVHT